MKLALLTATLAAGFGRHLDSSRPEIPFIYRLLACCMYAAIVGSIGMYVFEL